MRSVSNSTKNQARVIWLRLVGVPNPRYENVMCHSVFLRFGNKKIHKHTSVYLLHGNVVFSFVHIRMHVDFRLYFRDIPAKACETKFVIS